MRVASIAVCAAAALFAFSAESVGFGAFREAEVSSIKPVGEMRRWCETQAKGLASHHAEQGYPYNVNLWAGDADKLPPNHVNTHERKKNWWWQWEQTAYLADGIARLGIFLDDRDLLSETAQNVQYTVSTARGDGLLGPSLSGGWCVFGEKSNSRRYANLWPSSIFSRALLAYYWHTRDGDVLRALERHCEAASTRPLQYRDLSVIETMSALYRITGDAKWRDMAVKCWDGRVQFKMSPDLTDEALASTGSVGRVHGVSGAELGKIPAALYLASGRRKDLDAAVNFFERVFRDNALADGVPSSNEHYSGKDGAMEHETCTVTDTIWALGYLLMATGDGVWGDRIERMYWNAGRACVTPDFKAVQYFSSPNQIAASSRSSRAFSTGKYGRYGAQRVMYRPGHDVECCAGNVHRLTPAYLSRAWMKRSSDSAPVAALYCDSVFVYESGDVAMQLEERSDYPFSGRVFIKVSTFVSVKTPIVFRVPSWTRNAEALVNGEVVKTDLKPGSFAEIDREWRNGDVLVLDFPMAVRQERNGDGLSFYRGPVLFSLPVEAKRTDHVSNSREFPKCSKDFPAIELDGSSVWNYGVRWHGEWPDYDVVDVVSRGRRDVALRVPARRVPSWTDAGEKGKTPFVPKGVQKDDGEDCTITLVPMMNTLLRVSVFPEIGDF